MEDLSGLFPGVQRHGPRTWRGLVLEFGFGSGSDTEDPPTLPSLDLFDRRRPPSVSPDQDPDLLGRGLGLGFAGQEDQVRVRHRQQDQEHGEAFDGWAGDEFFIDLRSAGRERGNGFFESDSEQDYNEQIVAIGPDPDPGLPLCLDGLRIDNPSSAAAEEFEWEEIDGVTADVIREDDFQEDISVEMGGIVEEVADVARDGIVWEVPRQLVWEVHPLDSHYVNEVFEDDFVYTSGHDDLLFGPFLELKGGRPASKSVIESLPTVVLKKEEVNCAVCKDEISSEEKAKKLPCCHYYHEECILLWLGMRSTCPLCRYELPTDDLEYEKRKARRAGSNSGEGQV